MNAVEASKRSVYMDVPINLIPSFQQAVQFPSF